jgi:hypothetical protein
MNEEDKPFNIHAARRLEDIRLSMLMEESAVQRGTELNAALRAAAARGGALSGGTLKQELDIIFKFTERAIERAIAYRKELGGRVPDMLLAFPYLKEFHSRLDEMADGAVITLQQHHARPAAKAYPAGALAAIDQLAARQLQALKAEIGREIQAMALEGELGMHRDTQPQINISHNTIATLNLGTVLGDLNGSIRSLSTAGQDELAKAVRELTEAVASSELTNKKRTLENLAYVAEQAALPTEQRRTGPLHATMDSIKVGIAVASQLVPLWLKVEEALKGMGIGH